MRRIIIALLIILIAALVTAGISLALQPELLRSGPGGGPNWTAIALVFGVALAGVAGVTQAVIAVADRRPARPDHAPAAEGPRFDAAHLARQRATMLDVVDRHWIQGRLARSLHNQAPLFLGLAEQPDAVRRPWEYEIQAPDQPFRRTWDTGEILRVFKRSCGLLILGAPGAGKTVTLLDLARQLIEEARGDAAAAIPVVFPLSSWAQQRGPLAEWLIDELKRQYRVPVELGRWWVERWEILPLLDGLDEVDADAQAACIAAINAYRTGVVGGAALAVCCRAEDYRCMGAALELEAAVTIQPLTTAQIERYIGRLGSQGEPVRRLLAENAELAALARAPLWLDVMSVAYARQDGEVSPAPRTPADIFNDYIRRVLLQHREPLREFSPAQSLRWLRWLAGQLERTDQTTLRLEAMQPDWLPGEEEERRYKRSVGWLAGGLTALFFWGLAYAFATVVVEWLLALLKAAGTTIGAATYGQFVAAICTLAFLLWSSHAFAGDAASKEEAPGRFIAAATGPQWSWRRAKRGARDSLNQYWPLTIILISGIALLAALRGHWLRILLLVPAQLISTRIFVALGCAFSDGLEPAYGISHETHPDDEVRRTLRAATIGALALAGFGGFCGTVIVGLTRGAAMGLMWGLSASAALAFVGWYYTGGRTVLRHLVLRWRFYRLGLMPAPWRYVRFLQAMDGHMLLDRIGGAYKFKHDLLQRHIARLDEETIAALVA